MKTIFKSSILLVISSFFLFQSCGLLLSTRIFQETDAAYTDYSNGIKKLRFVGTHHIGKPEYYESVQNLIAESKKEGYVLFYEWIDFDMVTDFEKRKIRKLIGFIPTPEGYAKMIDKLGDNTLVPQKLEPFLNLVNDKDIRTDLTAKEVIDLYEEHYGKLQLSDLDRDTPLTESIKMSEPKHQVFDILLNKRNNYLSEKILKSDYPKIIVIYGKSHEKGLIKLLIKEDFNWSKVN